MEDADLDTINFTDPSDVKYPSMATKGAHQMQLYKSVRTRDMLPSSSISEIEGPGSLLSQNHELDQDEQTEESEELMIPESNEDLCKLEITGCSQFVYQHESTSSPEHPSREIDRQKETIFMTEANNSSAGNSGIRRSSNNMICSEATNAFTVPAGHSQGQIPSGLLVATHLGQSMTPYNPHLAPNAPVSNSPHMTPLWLQILSNLLSRTSENKATSDCSMTIPLLPEVQPPAVKTEGKRNMSHPHTWPQVGTATSDIPNSSTKAESSCNETASRAPLLEITNQCKRKTDKGRVFVLSPISNTSVVKNQGVPTSARQANTHTSGSHGKLPSVTCQQLTLNSSGEESRLTSPLKDCVKPDPSFLKHRPSKNNLCELKFPLPSTSPVLEQDVGGGGGPMRESHNMKERRRRARIKDACNLMRQLVPGMSNKTDKATVFEFSARYIHFLKSIVGTNNDKDFLVKYNPY